MTEKIWLIASVQGEIINKNVQFQKKSAKVKKHNKVTFHEKFPQFRSQNRHWLSYKLDINIIDSF